MAELDHIPLDHPAPPLPNPLLKAVPLTPLGVSLFKLDPFPKLAKGFLVCKLLAQSPREKSRDQYRRRHGDDVVEVDCVWTKIIEGCDTVLVLEATSSMNFAPEDFCTGS